MGMGILLMMTLNTKRVDELTSRDRLVPLLRSLLMDDYSILNNVCTGMCEYEHKFVLANVRGKREKEYQGHHKNGNKFDNRVSNLEWMRYDEHFSYHLTKRNSEGGDFGWQNTTGVHPKGMLGKTQTSLQKSVSFESYSEEMGKMEEKQSFGTIKKFLGICILLRG